VFSRRFLFSTSKQYSYSLLPNLLPGRTAQAGRSAPSTPVGLPRGRLLPSRGDQGSRGTPGDRPAVRNPHFPRKPRKCPNLAKKGPKWVFPGKKAKKANFGHFCPFSGISRKMGILHRGAPARGVDVKPPSRRGPGSGNPGISEKSRFLRVFGLSGPLRGLGDPGGSPGRALKGPGTRSRTPGPRFRPGVLHQPLAPAPRGSRGIPLRGPGVPAATLRRRPGRPGLRVLSL